jgi:hypothetical protein
MRRRGLEVALTGLRDPVRDVLARTRLLEKIGEGRLYTSMEQASRVLCCRSMDHNGDHRCPLRDPIPLEVPEETSERAEESVEGVS